MDNLVAFLDWVGRRGLWGHLWGGGAGRGQGGVGMKEGRFKIEFQPPARPPHGAQAESLARGCCIVWTFIGESAAARITERWGRSTRPLPTMRRPQGRTGSGTRSSTPSGASRRESWSGASTPGAAVPPVPSSWMECRLRSMIRFAFRVSPRHRCMSHVLCMSHVCLSVDYLLFSPHFP